MQSVTPFNPGAKATSAQATDRGYEPCQQVTCHSGPQIAATNNNQRVIEAATIFSKTMVVPSQEFQSSLPPDHRELQPLVPQHLQNFFTVPEPNRQISSAQWHSLDTAMAIQAYSPPEKTALSASAPTISGFFTQNAPFTQKPIFGMDYVAEVAIENFYIRERPSVPQPGDVVIKTPILESPGDFQDGFEVDMIGHGMHFLRQLKDLPDKTILCSQRRKKRAYNPTIIICSGSSTNTNDLVATVRKAGDKKAIIELEKQGQVEYTVEGDLHQRNYIVKLNATQVAQVSHDDEHARAAVTSRHCYSVQVAPGTDCVLMIAAAMAIEDLYAN